MAAWLGPKGPTLIRENPSSTSGRRGALELRSRNVCQHRLLDHFSLRFEGSTPGPSNAMSADWSRRVSQPGSYQRILWIRSITQDPGGFLFGTHELDHQSYVGSIESIDGCHGAVVPMMRNNSPKDCPLEGLVCMMV